MMKLKIYRLIIIPALIVCKVSIAQTTMLTKIGGGASWDYLAFSSGNVNFMPSSGGYITDNQDYTIIDEENRTKKTISLHDGTPGQDNPPHGMIINIVNRSSQGLPFSGGGANGYESINGTFLLGISANIAANSSISLQWNNATSRWYEIL